MCQQSQKRPVYVAKVTGLCGKGGPVALTHLRSTHLSSKRLHCAARWAVSSGDEEEEEADDDAAVDDESAAAEDESAGDGVEAEGAGAGRAEGGDEDVEETPDGEDEGGRAHQTG